jgi:Uma2 family endonuclease
MTIVAQIEKRYYTPAEYLELEEKGEYKSEYHDGEIVPMTGGTTNHNKIAGNLYFYLKSALREQAYEIYIGDVRLWIPVYRRYTYPDIMIIKGQPMYEGTGQSTVTNPCLIVEVLSNSTKDYDRGDKFKVYRSIPELQEYILIDQYSFNVEQFVKQSPTEWKLKEYQGKEQTLVLESIDFHLSLVDIYERVDFEVDS